MRSVGCSAEPGDRRVCTTGRFVMVMLDSNGTPLA